MMSELCQAVAESSPVERNLHALAADNNYQLLELVLVEGDEGLHDTDRHGQTPLNVAARLGHAEVVKVSFIFFMAMTNCNAVSLTFLIISYE